MPHTDPTAGVQQPDVLRKAMAVRMSDGAPLFDCVQATFNLLEPSVGGSLRAYVGL